MKTKTVWGGAKALAVIGGIIGVLAGGATPVHASANIVILNADGPGEGFNDPTAAAPVGGNPGTTVGQQRLNVFQHAADIWASKLDSNVTILVRAQFNPLFCTPVSGVLGAAGTTYIIANFGGGSPFYPGPLLPDTWHSAALGNKRAGADLVPELHDIGATFNSNVGKAGCLPTRPFYYGLDGNEGTGFDLAAIVLHELSHGLGFQQFANVTSGAMPAPMPGAAGWPDTYNVNIFDNTQGLSWPQMTNDQRKASAVNTRNVVFDGANLTAAVPLVLRQGDPGVRVNSPASIAGLYAGGDATFGPLLTLGGLTGNVVAALDPADAAGPTTTDACSPLTNPEAVAGNLAIVDRGMCGFTVKVKNAQDAGAIGVIVADNLPGPVGGMSGMDPTITIPSVRVTKATGDAIRGELPGGVNATIGLFGTTFAGADPAGRALLHTPALVAPASTISHYDVSATPNQLMEPFFTPDAPHDTVEPPRDLTLPLLRDVGWFPDTDVDGLANDLDACPDAFDGRPTVFVGPENTGVGNVVFTNGCTLNDLLTLQAEAANNHGQFVSGVTHLLKDLEDAGIITKDERTTIHGAVAHADVP